MATQVYDSQRLLAPKLLDDRKGRFVGGIFRPYLDMAEVLQYNPSGQRAIGQEYNIGTISNYVTYEQRGGLADSNIVIKAGGGSATTDASQLTSGILPLPRLADASITPAKLAGLATPSAGLNANVINAWGDSLTLGTGGTQTTQYISGIPYMEYVRQATGYGFINSGYGGNTSTQIKDKSLLSENLFKRALPTVIFVGTNDLGQNDTILANIATIVANLGHTRYLVLTLPGHSNSTFWSGTGSYQALIALNNSIKTTYGVRAVDIRQPLIDAYNPGSSQDVADHGHDIPPTSLFYPDDPVHFNDVGYRIIANAIIAKIQYLAPSGTDLKVLTSDGFKDMFSNAPVIGLTRPNIGRFSNISLNKAISSKYFFDGQNGLRDVVLDIDGAATFYHPNPGTNATKEGLVIKPRFPDEGGSSNMEIAGTSATWVSGSGIKISNDSRLISIGSSAANTPLTVYGNTNISGEVNGGALLTTGRVVFATGLTNQGPYTTPTRILDLVNPGGSMAGGIAIPTLANGNEPGLFQAKHNEIFYNTELDRFRVGHKYSSNNNLADYKSLAYLDDIIPVQLFNGADISISGNATTGYTIARASAPPVAKLTGTPYVNEPSDAPGDNDVSADPARAFDGDLTTYARTYPYEFRANAGIGLDLASPYTITKIRLIGVPGQILDGAILQGSNTSSSTGYVDLLALPNGLNTFNNTVNELAVSNVNPYRWVRIKCGTGNFNGVLYITELEIYGYKSSDITVAPNSALTLNTTTKVLNLPAATNSVDGYLTAADHTTFAAKQGALTLTTTGTSGAATLIGNTLNIPQYSGSASSAILYSTTGANTDGAMTQAATTTALGLKANSANASFTGTFFSAGDVEITTIGAGIIMKDPNGVRYRYTPAVGGALSFVAL